MSEPTTPNERDALIAAYTEACKNMPPDHNQIGLHYFMHAWKAAQRTDPAAPVAWKANTGSLTDSERIAKAWESNGFTVRPLVYTHPQASTAAVPEGAEAVAIVKSYTSGSYHRNYKLEWLRDVPEGTKLYAHPNAERLKHAGAMLSNCAFNLAQRKAGEPLTEADIRALDSSRKAWDAARTAEEGKV